MIKVWHDDAWDDYLYWQEHDRKILRRINSIIKDMERDPFNGIGKPEPLRHDFAGWWSRRIDGSNRIVYRVKEGKLEIAQCGSHYREK